MVAHVIRTADENVPFAEVTASRGKAVRAEPVAALYEQGRVTHVGELAQLEDQMCLMGSDGYLGDGSPDRLDAMVWGLSFLMCGPSTTGIIEFTRRAAEAAKTKNRPGEKLPESRVRMRSPSGVSVAYGRSGEKYMPDADGMVLILEPDVVPLRGAGFVEIAAAPQI
jgi:hypothetical protein